MTFDELMVKYQPLIEKASVDDLGPALLELKPETDTRFKRLVEALEQDLAGSLEGPNLRKGAVMAAKELVSRFRFPEGGGVAGEGAFAGPCYSEVDGLDPAEAAEPAPPPVVVEVLADRESFLAAEDRVKSDPGPKWYVETIAVAKQVPQRKP